AWLRDNCPACGYRSATSRSERISAGGGGTAKVPRRLRDVHRKCAVVCHSFFVANVRAATSNVARIVLHPNRSHRVDTPKARRYMSLRSRAAAGTGRRQAPPRTWIGGGGASPRSCSTETEEGPVPGEAGALGATFSRGGAP